MNSETGKIVESRELVGIQRPELDKFFEISEDQMTEKQKASMQVSPYDNKSELGKLRIKNKNRFRNKPCPCGSGKKFKKCCWSKYE